MSLGEWTKLRHEFGKVMYELMQKDDKVYLICGDIGFGIFNDLRSDPKTKDRFLNIGINEQAMIGVAAGMALSGLKPWVYTITPFLIERPFEQVKLDIDQQKANVKLVGYADYPSQGPTHAEIITPRKAEQLFTNIVCYLPRNSEHTRMIVESEHKINGPAFISLKKDREEIENGNKV